MGNASRRDFIAQLSGLSGVAVMQASGLWRFAASQEQPSTDALIPRMKWMNEPASWRVSGSRIAVHTRPKTDFWRKTFYGYVTDNGHFLYLPVTGDFTFEARIGGNYRDLYDQAGLMVRVDAENWMKCGTEDCKRASEGKDPVTLQTHGGAPPHSAIVFNSKAFFDRFSFFG